jgi:hypothetical protein
MPLEEQMVQCAARITSIGTLLEAGFLVAIRSESRDAPTASSFPPIL